MQAQAQISGVGTIYAALSAVSQRPRYAFLVLQLVAEAADAQGRAGPYVMAGNTRMLLRDWLSTQLFPISEQGTRRAALRARVIATLQHKLTGNVEADAGRIERAVEEQVRATGRSNVSRAISDLVRAGLMTRHYAGYATNHENRGGGRHAVYVVAQGAMTLLGKSPVPWTGATVPRASSRPTALQGDLFSF